MTARHFCCETCIWWEQGGSLIATEPRNLVPRPGRGACHVAPPVPLQLAPGRVSAVLPETIADFYCGEWEEVLDEVEPDGPDDGERVDDKVVPIRSAAA